MNEEPDDSWKVSYRAEAFLMADRIVGHLAHIIEDTKSAAARTAEVAAEHGTDPTVAARMFFDVADLLRQTADQCADAADSFVSSYENGS